MKYNVTNRLECKINIGKISFNPKETKELNFKPTSDRFIVEKIIIKNNIEKIDKKGETVSEVPKKNQLKRRKK